MTRRRCSQLEKEWERQGAAQGNTEVCHGNCYWFVPLSLHWSRKLCYVAAHSLLFVRLCWFCMICCVFIVFILKEHLPGTSVTSFQVRRLPLAELLQEQSPGNHPGLKKKSRFGERVPSGDSRLAESWPIKEQKELEKETPSKKTQYKGLTSGKAKREKQVGLGSLWLGFSDVGMVKQLGFCRAAGTSKHDGEKR